MPYARGDIQAPRPRRGMTKTLAPSLVTSLRDYIGSNVPGVDASVQIANMSRTRVPTASNAGPGQQFAYKAPQMNPANIHALRRAMRRLERAEKLYSKIFTFRHGHTKGAVMVRTHHKKGK